MADDSVEFWFSRAASHGDNYLEVAMFDNAEQAKKAAKALKAFIREVDQDHHNDYDWSIEDASCYAPEDRVYFSVYTAWFGLDDLESIIEKQGGKVVASGTDLRSIAFTITKPSVRGLCYLHRPAQRILRWGESPSWRKRSRR